LFFENYGQEIGGTDILLVPQPKIWGTQSPLVPTVVAPIFLILNERRYSELITAVLSQCQMFLLV